MLPGAIVPVSPETVAGLTAEIKRLLESMEGADVRQRRQWIGLSDDDLEDLLGFHCDIYGEMNEVDAKKFAADIEKRLKEKNA